MMDMIATMIAQKVGINPEIAKIAIPLVSKFLLQKAPPQQASGLLSTMPSEITGLFSAQEKKDFSSTQQNLTEDELINSLDQKCGINDKAKSKQIVSEILNSLQQNSGKQAGDLLSNVTGNLGKGGFNPFG